MVRLFSYFLLTAVLSGLFVQIAWTDERLTPKSLWQTVTALPPISQPSMPRKPWILREREIVLDLPLLRVLKDAGARPLPGITIELSIKPAPNWMSPPRCLVSTRPPSSAAPSSLPR